MEDATFECSSPFNPSCPTSLLFRPYIQSPAQPSLWNRPKSGHCRPLLASTLATHSCKPFAFKVLPLNWFCVTCRISNRFFGVDSATTDRSYSATLTRGGSTVYLAPKRDGPHISRQSLFSLADKEATDWQLEMKLTMNEMELNTWIIGSAYKEMSQPLHHFLFQNQCPMSSEEMALFRHQNWRI